MCFRPNEIINRFNEFDIEAHRKMGFETIFMDIDNTIDIPDNPSIASNEAYDFLSKLEKAGFKIIIISNNTKKRVERFLNGLNYDYSFWSFKPLPFIYIKFIKKYQLDPKKVISFGDQMLTDCVGANMVGIYSLYSKQLIEKDIVKTKINRMIERFIFKHILHEEM